TWAEFLIYQKNYDKLIWYRTAWLASNIMNMWTERGKAITPEKLLGKGFMSKEKQVNKEEWQQQKDQLRDMAIKHRKILGRLKAGKLQSKPVTKTKGR
nr:hypothetical protein [Candidatus Aminicenantes bacterium]